MIRFRFRFGTMAERRKSAGTGETDLFLASRGHELLERLDGPRPGILALLKRDAEPDRGLVQLQHLQLRQKKTLSERRRKIIVALRSKAWG